MSEENRPNLNAVGLAVDIISSIEKHTRGQAGQESNASRVFELTSNLIRDFVVDTNDILDNEFEE